MNEAIDDIHVLQEERKTLPEPKSQPIPTRIPELEDQKQEQRDVIYDNPQKIIKQYEQRIIELEQKYDKVIMSYVVKDVIIAPNGQELPIIIEVDPYMRTAKPELDQKEIKKLMEF